MYKQYQEGSQSQSQIFRILDVKAMQIYDSRGIPTVQCEIKTLLGKFRASVPSGASTGKYQAVELRDNNIHINLGKSVHQAVENVNTIIKSAIIGKDCRKQEQIDRFMIEQLDGSKNEYGWNKGKLGANAILSVSMAICRAAAAGQNLSLFRYIRKLKNKGIEDKQPFIIPNPAFNVINGGKHGGNILAMQQFMIIPTGAKDFKEAMQIGTQCYQVLKKILHRKYGISSINVGDEGGFAPPINNHLQALQLIQNAISQSGHTGKVSIAMDCAASEFFSQQLNAYNLRFKEKGRHQVKSTQQLFSIYQYITQNYPVISIEDGFDQDDWNGWCQLTKQIGSKVQIVGDDLLVTNLRRIDMAISKKACNALLLKINQIGTISEAISAANLAKQNGWEVMVSHRSGQTQDNFISHLVVGLGTGQIKTGAPCRSERLAKYNELLRIQNEIGQQGRYWEHRYAEKRNEKK